MRIPAVLTLLSVLVVGCAPQPSDPVARADTCRLWFQTYDRELSLNPQFFSLGPASAFDRTWPSGQSAESALRQFRCLTLPRDMPDLAVLGDAFAKPAGSTQGPRSYLHVATTTSDASAGELAAAFRSLGYPATTRGAPRLGRRVFVGPLRSPEEQAAAQSAANALGFLSAYFVTRIP